MDRPKHITQGMEVELRKEMDKFYPKYSEDKIITWDKNDALIILLKFKPEEFEEYGYIILQGFYDGDKPSVSIVFKGYLSELIQYLMDKMTNE